MTYQQTDQDRQEADLLRKLLTEEEGLNIEEVLKETFTPLVKWTKEDVEVQLSKVYQFSTAEVSKLMDIFPIHIPTNREVIPFRSPTPNLKEESKEDLMAQAAHLCECRADLRDLKKNLSKAEITIDHYVNQTDQEDAICEVINITTAFHEIEYFINSQLEHVNKHLLK